MGSTVSSDAETRKENTWVSGKSPGGEAKRFTQRSRSWEQRGRREESRGWRRNKCTQGVVIEGRRWPVDGSTRSLVIASTWRAGSAGGRPRPAGRKGSVKW